MKDVILVTPKEKTRYYEQRCKEMGLTPKQAPKHGIYMDAKTGDILQAFRDFEGNEITLSLIHI